MVRRRSRLLAGLATALLVGVAAPAAPTHAAPDTAQKHAPEHAPKHAEYDPPLEISIDALTPGLLPRTGPLVVRGTVTNVDLESWERVNLYPMFGSGAPSMTTGEELSAAVATDPEAQVGDRYTEDLAVRAEVTSLGPGESTDYTIRIPQRVLRQEFPDPTTGVYWFGVHALGENADGRDDLADGRARTFLPYVAPGAGGPVDTAVVVPLRGRVAHSADGELGRTTWWDDALAPDGTLGGPLAFGAASGTAPVTWLVDPAVPDAVGQLAAGNPIREIAPVAPVDEPSGSESPSASESGSEDADGDDDDAGAGGDDGAEVGGATLQPDSALVRAAQTWLDEAGTVLPDDTVAVLPYGDPDLAAAARALPSLYATARRHPAATLSAWGVEGTPVVASRNGYLDAAAIANVDDDATVLLGEQAFPAEGYPAGPPVGGLVGDRPVVTTSTATARGGPGPDRALAPVALRQRLLSEAVVRMLAAADARPDPITVVLPSGIDAADAREFWSQLDPAVVSLVDLPTIVHTNDLVADDADRQIDPDELTYPEGQLSAQLDSGVFREAGALIRAGRSLQGILGEGYTIGDTLVGEALAGTSYSMRDDSDAAPRLGRSRAWVSDQLDQVTLDAPQGVTLSSSSGSFNVAIANTLDHAVTVRIEAATDTEATIKAANPIVLAANSRSSVPISADMHGNGVHNVRLRLTDADGTPIGAEDELPIRSGQVGVVIWAIIGTGAGILFVAIGIRLVRRFRSRGQGGDTPDEVTA